MERPEARTTLLTMVEEAVEVEMEAQPGLMRLAVLVELVAITLMV
jgi:hypothetical protein